MFATTDWRAVGHAVDERWVNAVERVGPWLFGLVVAGLVARGLWRAARYSAVHALSEEDRDALRAKVEEAETKTSAEIVVVVVERSDAHPDACWKAGAAMVALGTLLCAGLLPWWSPSLLLGAQVGLAVMGAGIALWLADVRRMFVGERRATEVAEEQAVQEFQRLELAQLEGRDAVLLFVSLFEQRVVVLADEGVEVSEDVWVEVDREVLEGVRGRSLRAGLERGIACASKHLAKAHPAGAERTSRVRDEVEVRRE